MIGKILKLIGALVVLCLVVGVIAAVVSPNKSPTTSTQIAAPVAARPTAEVVRVVETLPTQVVPTDAPVAAPTAASVAVAPVKPAGVGDRAVSGGIALTVLNMKRASKLGIFKADAGNEFVVIEVVIENVDRDESPHNPLYFKLKDSDGFEYNYSIATPNPSLKSGDLKRGGKARGNVAFEVKKGAKGLVVSYEPLVLFGGYETISIGLE